MFIHHNEHHFYRGIFTARVLLAGLHLHSTIIVSNNYQETFGAQSEIGSDVRSMSLFRSCGFKIS